MKPTSTSTKKAKQSTSKVRANSVWNRLAGIEYMGVAGSSEDCKNAVLRLIHFGDKITHARILTAGRNHCLLLTVNVGDLTAIKSGFASGYIGQGPRTFSYVLQALESHGAEIEEYKVSEELLARVDQSALTGSDLTKLDKRNPERHRRWHDYIFDSDWEREERGTLWRELPLTIPLSLIDNRLIDLASTFWDAPDDRLLQGYRRLEDHIRKRTGLNQHSAKLFSQAFHPSAGKLVWTIEDEGERAGRMNIFTGAYAAYRNPRAHGELGSNPEELLTEFLLLNHLYRLEAAAILREVDIITDKQAQ